MISGVLRLRSGLVNRSVRVVPITRITALAASQSLTQRLVGVWKLAVQSPGRPQRRRARSSAACPDPGSINCGPSWNPGTSPNSRTPEAPEPGEEEGESDRLPSTIQRYLAWRRTSSVRSGPDVIAVLKTSEMLIAAVTNNVIPLIFAGALVVWFRFSEFVPNRAADFMNETVEPRGIVAVLIALVVVAIVGGVVFGALRLNQFTLIRDGDVLRNSRGLLGKQSATIPIKRIQAVRIVEGFWRLPLGYCSLQVEVAGIGRANTNQRMLFPLVRTDRAEAMIRRALPELPWPSEPLLRLPTRVYRRYFTLPLEYGAGFTLLLLLLPGWWRLLALLPLPLGFALGYARPREARWRVDEHIGGAAVATAAHPQHGDRAPRRRAEHRMVELAVEGQGARRRVQDEVLLRPDREDPIHGRRRTRSCSARRRRAGPVSHSPLVTDQAVDEVGAGPRRDERAPDDGRTGRARCRPDQRLVTPTRQVLAVPWTAMSSSPIRCRRAPARPQPTVTAPARAGGVVCAAGDLHGRLRRLLQRGIHFHRPTIADRACRGAG